MSLELHIWGKVWLYEYTGEREEKGRAIQRITSFFPSMYNTANTVLECKQWVMLTLH